MNAFYVSPAIVALLIFYYQRNKQAARNDRRRERFLRMYEKLMQTLQDND